jgi:aminopeptidase N
MAHELSHHWWGNLVTCETQEDMWINEGMANFSEFLFTEWTYGYDKYITDVKAEHDEILRYGHLNEKGFRAISGIPHQYTYGDHVYVKGADVAHTLRSYMGDAAFFNGLKYILLQRPYKNINSNEFKTMMETSSGQSLGDFFNNWLLNGGWPHFSIDSIKSSGTSAPYVQNVYVKQKLTGAPNLFANVPLEIQFMNNSWSTETKTISMTGATKSFTLSSNLPAHYVAINFNSKISDAVSSEYKTIKNITSYNYNLAKALLTVINKGQDSSLIRVEHNITAPDAIRNNTNNFRLNTQHYWKIDGLLSSGFHSKLRLNYDGNKSTSGIGYMDTCLILANADSLILLYRKNAADDWEEVKHYTKTKFTTKTGMFNVDTLKLGEYVFANGKSSVIIGLEEKQKNKNGFQVKIGRAHV